MNNWGTYYGQHPDIFIKNYFNIELLPFQKIILRLHIRLYNNKLDKQAVKDMYKFYNINSNLYMNMYFWSSIGSKYGYERCKNAERKVLKLINKKRNNKVIFYINYMWYYL